LTLAARLLAWAVGVGPSLRVLLRSGWAKRRLSHLEN
jgi:hypothetical protein